MLHVRAIPAYIESTDSMIRNFNTASDGSLGLARAYVCIEDPIVFLLWADRVNMFGPG